MRLIDADKLKKSLNYIYDCAYIESKSKEGIASDIIDEIDNAPTAVNEMLTSERPQGDMLPVGTTFNINPEDVKWNDGDLISREALREDLRRFFTTEVLDGIEPKTLFAQIMHDIDNAPAASDRYYEGYAQGYIHGSTGADWQGE